MDQIRGFIGLSAAGDDLIKIPVADAKKDSAIDLGTISSPTKDVAKASATIDQKSAELNVKTDYLREMASVDGVLRGIKNDWANYNEKTGVFYTTAPFFNWYINLNGVPSGATDPASFTHTGFGIYFSTNDPRITLEALCSPSADSKHRRLEIIPPADVVDGSNVTYNANNTMSNSAVNGIQASGTGFDCGAGTFYANGSSPTGGAGFNVGGGGFPQAMPNGVWTLKFANDEIASFDLEAARPVDASGKPFVYIPSIKINSDGQSYIESIDVDFYTYDRTSETFKKVEDITVLSKTITPDVSFTDYSGTVASQGARVESGAPMKAPSSGATYRVTMGDFTLRNGSPSPKFKVPGDASTTEPAANVITVSYKIGKSVFRFDLRGGY